MQVSARKDEPCQHHRQEKETQNGEQLFIIHCAF